MLKITDSSSVSFIKAHADRWLSENSAIRLAGCGSHSALVSCYLSSKIFETYLKLKKNSNNFKEYEKSATWFISVLFLMYSFSHIPLNPHHLISSSSIVTLASMATAHLSYISVFCFSFVLLFCSLSALFFPSLSIYLCRASILIELLKSLSNSKG